MKRFISLLLSVFLVFSLAACNAEPVPISDDGDSQSVSSETAKMTFTLVVCDLDGNETEKEIKTDKKTVGDALYSQGIIDGEQGDYGLYVKTVNGVTLDYKKDGAYWSFYIGENYASKSVDQTDIVSGETYMLKAEKAQ